jgi:hypothetical protein
MKIGNDDTYIQFTGDGKLDMIVNSFLLKGSGDAPD